MTCTYLRVKRLKSGKKRTYRYTREIKVRQRSVVVNLRPAMREAFARCRNLAQVARELGVSKTAIRTALREAA